ncbi:NUDIX domain-containing protein [Micromonospora viridifaciens]|uniref:NUDIX domain-containing protein n=1 Tax=Micromonospora viridifaciens TaxID=1881 RepID=A0A1C4X800_MICVI|nr:NUDIX domain-containing protein [Micromonospora viridifaciens]SCF04592.1 NUDIX domain-containing protein [Micromonospora viridifaciens]
MREIDKVAWIRIEDGRVLCARSRGKDAWYLPGGKREAGETDLETLAREVAEELGVEIAPESAVPVGTFTAQAHGRAAGTVVRMTCYAADYRGTPRPASEIEELAWLGYADRHRVSPANQLVFDHLRSAGALR